MMGLNTRMKPGFASDQRLCR